MKTETDVPKHGLEQTMLPLTMFAAAALWLVFLASAGFGLAVALALGAWISQEVFLASLTVDSIRVGPHQLPTLWTAYTNVGARLGIAELPPLYLQRRMLTARPTRKRLPAERGDGSIAQQSMLLDPSPRRSWPRVNQAVAHRNDLRPGDLGVRCLHRSRRPRGSLADDLPNTRFQNERLLGAGRRVRALPGVRAGKGAHPCD
jgi:hypothetical protein